MTLTPNEHAMAMRALAREIASGKVTFVTEKPNLPRIHSDEQQEQMRLRCQARRDKFKAMGLPSCGHDPARENCRHCVHFWSKKRKSACNTEGVG